MCSEACNHAIVFALTVRQVPFALFLITHAYFTFYHSLTTVRTTGMAHSFARPRSVVRIAHPSACVPVCVCVPRPFLVAPSRLRWRFGGCGHHTCTSPPTASDRCSSRSSSSLRWRTSPHSWKPGRFLRSEILKYRCAFRICFSAPAWSCACDMHSHRAVRRGGDPTVVHLLCVKE